MDCSLPGSSVHGDSLGKNKGCHAFLQGIFPAQRLNPGLPHCRQILYHLSHQGSLRILECPFSRGSSWPRNWTGVSCIAGRFFISWATREVPLGRYLLLPIASWVRLGAFDMWYILHSVHATDIFWGLSVCRHRIHSTEINKFQSLSTQLLSSSKPSASVHSSSAVSQNCDTTPWPSTFFVSQLVCASLFPASSLFFMAAWRPSSKSSSNKPPWVMLSTLPPATFS